ncbi:MAG: transcriptional regulator, partial [Candidatus Iainarchaeum archaeon]
MKEKELKFLISQGEGYNIEFKEKFSASIAKDICAFANSNGGRILLGVTDDGKIKGIKITNKLKSQICDLARNFDPKFEVFLEEAGNVLIVNVPEGQNKPYAFSGKFYMRNGPNSQQLSRKEIREFFISEGLVHFDEKPNYDFDLRKDFNKRAYRTFLQLAKISELIDKKDLFENLCLLKENKLKNAGVLLFCKKITKFFSHATITCITFQGKERMKILDRKEFDADLYSNFRGALGYLREKLNTEYIIRGAGPREEKLELPEEALREALLNAIGHRNYFMRTSVFVEIYSDRVEITNPGGLVKGLSREDLGKKSLPRNNLLFGLLQRMNLVEKAGTGIRRMQEAMRNYKLEPPEIKAGRDWFTIVFKRP